MRALDRAAVGRIQLSPFGRSASRYSIGVNRGNAQSEGVVRQDTGRKGRADAKAGAALRWRRAKGAQRRLRGDSRDSG
jgi:hypothetical protein